MSNEILDRIKKACMSLRNDFLLGQTVEDPGGEYHIMQRMNLEFVYPDSLPQKLCSKMIRDGKKIVLYLEPISKLLDHSIEPTNATLKAVAFRVIVREIWWYNKGVPEHETPLDHLLSKESVAAFLDGYEQADRKIKLESN